MAYDSTKLRQFAEAAVSEGYDPMSVAVFVRKKMQESGIGGPSFQLGETSTAGTSATIRPAQRINTQMQGSLDPAGFLTNEENRIYMENVQRLAREKGPAGVKAMTPEAITAALQKNIERFEPKTSKRAFSDLIQKHFPQEEWDRAYNVMMGESKGNPQAVGDDYPIAGVHAPSYGLFQIRAQVHGQDPDKMLNPEENVKYAANLWKRQGRQPWTVAKDLGYVR